MRWYLERMMKVLREPQPGGFLLGQHLAQMMLVEALRLYRADGVKDGAGWLFALADKQLSAAITAMHENPGYRWSLQELAERAGMSRSIFDLRFKEKVGTSAMDYLTRWRMLRSGPTAAFVRFRFSHRPIIRLCIGERLWTGLQEGDGLLAAAI